jgi:hypothetical protein
VTRRGYLNRVVRNSKIVRPMSESGHSRRGRADSKPGDVPYAPKAEVNLQHEGLPLMSPRPSRRRKAQGVACWMVRDAMEKRVMV